MALTLAAIGAAVSLYGLIAMFGMAFLPIGLGLEAGKLTSAAALHQSWTTLGWRIRYALSGIVVTLMVLTSSGIYGFTLTRYLAHVAAITSPVLERATAAEAEVGPVKIVADVFGVDPGKVVAAAVAAIYDALCVLLLLVAGHKPGTPAEMPAQAVIETAAVVVAPARKRTRKARKPAGKAK